MRVSTMLSIAQWVSSSVASSSMIPDSTHMLGA